MVQKWVSHNITVKSLPLVLQFRDMHFNSDCMDYNPKFYVE